MSGYTLRLPDGYDPQAEGWQPVPGMPDAAPPMFLRWEVPYQYPASLCLLAQEGSAVHALYMHPAHPADPEGGVRLGTLWAELEAGKGGGVLREA